MAEPIMFPEDVAKSYLGNWEEFLLQGLTEAPLHRVEKAFDDTPLKVLIPHFDVTVLRSLVDQAEMLRDQLANLRAIVGDLEAENASLEFELGHPAEVSELRATIRRLEADKSDFQPPTVGQALKAILAAKDMSQVGLARAISASDKHINELVRGSVPLTTAFAVKIAGATGIPASVWIGIQAARMEWEARFPAEDTP